MVSFDDDEKEYELGGDRATAASGHREPGKVDAYRFMTFYLDADAENGDVFFHRVVDPTWLAGTSPAAAALRQARQHERRPKCWRVMHRVTYVSRVIGDGGATTPLEEALAEVDLASNHELVRVLDPFIAGKKGSLDEFKEAVADAVKAHLPSLVDHLPELTWWLVRYHHVTDASGHLPRPHDLGLDR